MSIDRTIQEKRNNLIFADYADMYLKEGLREEIVFNRLSEKYFITPATIYRIVLKIKKGDTVND